MMFVERPLQIDMDLVLCDIVEGPSVLTSDLARQNEIPE